MTADRGQSVDRREFPFSVDGKHFKSDTATLTGAQIKAIAGIDPAWGLFLEGRGDAPNMMIGDGDVVDLSQPGREQLFSMPGAVFGAPRPWRAANQ